jgi:uncharacterized protein (TIGR00369 family)
MNHTEGADRDKGISEQRADYLAKDYCRGFIKHCRFEADDIRPGYFQFRVRIEDYHRQQDGFIHAGVMATMAVSWPPWRCHGHHGGVMATMADHTAGYAAFTTVAEEFQILTIEFKINFLKPAYRDVLICRSKVIRGGNSIIVSESEVFDERDGVEFLAAKAMVTLMAVHRDKLS